MTFWGAFFGVMMLCRETERHKAMSNSLNNFKLFFLIKSVDKLPLAFCYAQGVTEAKHLLKSKIGYIVPYSALANKTKFWADQELSLCPLYERGKDKGFSLAEWQNSKSVLPIALRVTA